MLGGFELCCRATQMEPEDMKPFAYAPFTCALVLGALGLSALPTTATAGNAIASACMASPRGERQKGVSGREQVLSRGNRSAYFRYGGAGPIDFHPATR